LLARDKAPLAGNQHSVRRDDDRVQHPHIGNAGGEAVDVA
jgi:hypothetical protein